MTDRWRQFAELANPDGWYWETDREHRFVWMSESVERITGVPAGWHYGKSRTDIRSDNIDEESWNAHLTTLARHEPFVDFAFWRTGPDGNRWLSSSGRPFFDEDGGFCGYRGIGRDLTAERMLAEQAAMLDNIIDGIDETVGIWDAEDRLIYCNQAFKVVNSELAHMLVPGTPYADYLRQGIKEGLFPEAAEDPEGWISWRVHQHRNPGKPFDVARQDGRVLQIKEQKLADDVIVLIGQDVTQQRALTREIEQSRDRFTDFADVSSDWYWEQDADLRFTYMSESNRKHSGMAPSELIGKTRRESAPLAVTDEQWDAHDAVLARREPLVDFRIGRVNDEGQRRILSIYGRPFFDADGGFAGYRGIGRDITEQVELEEALRTAGEQAQAASVAKSEFLSSMSHELRTPLNSILGFAQLLETDQAAQSSKSTQLATANILRAGNHLLSLIGDLLDLSRIEMGTLELHIEPLPLNGLVEECLGTVEAMAKQRLIRINSRLDRGYRVDADEVRLKQVLLNLLSNAIKYNNQAGEIELTATVVLDGLVRISVRDSGTGIPREKFDQVFMPFDRLGARNSTVEGTGIGLTISKQIVEAMGGNIGFTSEVGVGSTFWFDVPISEDTPVVTPADPGSVHELPVQELAPTPDTLLLYIEDNFANQQLMEVVVERLEDLRLLCADDGETGLRLFQEHRPDAVLLDINLPGKNGYEVLRELHAMSGTEKIPIIGISANATAQDIEKAQQAGFDEYVTKPIDIPAFTTMLRGHLAGRFDPPS